MQLSKLTFTILVSGAQNVKYLYKGTLLLCMYRGNRDRARVMAIVDIEKREGKSEQRYCYSNKDCPRIIRPGCYKSAYIAHTRFFLQFIDIGNSSGNLAPT